jgi:hypothetical protein
MLLLASVLSALWSPFSRSSTPDREHLWTVLDPLPTPLSSERVSLMQCVVADDLPFPPHPTICTYGPSEWVSRKYFNVPAQTYEAKYVSHFLQAMAMDGPRLGFLDCGSNFGTFGVHMASRGYPTVLVDVNRDNLYLAHSSAKRNGWTRTADATPRMTLLNVAVGGSTGKMFVFNASGAGVRNTMHGIRKTKYNVGGLSFADSDLVPSARGADSKGAAGETMGVNVVPVLGLNDIGKLLPFRRFAMKMDIQGWEETALLAAGAFFERYDVRLLMIELPHTYRIDQFLRARGYLPWLSETHKLVDNKKVRVALNYTKTKVAWWYKQG